MQPEVSPPRPAVRGFPAQWEVVRDRCADPRVRFAALLLAAAIAGFWWYQIGRDQSAAALPPLPRSSAAAPKSTTTTQPPLLVHVAGAVVRPGLVRLATGARVADAIEAAGGGLPEADFDRLNLAAKVADGQRVAVPKIGAPAIAGSFTGGSGSSDGSGSSGGDGLDPGGAAGPVNLNTATLAQLDVLPGIGPSLAGAIMRERDRRGGFTSVEQLRDVRGIGEVRFADLKPLVTV